MPLVTRLQRFPNDISKNLIHPLHTSLILLGSFSRGNAGRDGDLWGGTGASGGGLTWPAARGGPVQWFPSGHYGPGVLEEHTGGTGKGGGASHRRGGVRSKGRKGAEIAGVRGSRHVFKFRKARPRAPLTDFVSPARETRSLTEARAETQRGNGEVRPSTGSG
jgi:hypothetical protein